MAKRNLRHADCGREGCRFHTYIPDAARVRERMARRFFERIMGHADNADDMPTLLRLHDMLSVNDGGVS